MTAKQILKMSHAIDVWIVGGVIGRSTFECGDMGGHGTRIQLRAVDGETDERIGVAIMHWIDTLTYTLEAPRATHLAGRHYRAGRYASALEILFNLRDELEAFR